MPNPARALSLIAFACLLSVPGLAQTAPPPPDNGNPMPDGADLGHGGDSSDIVVRSPKENKEWAWITLEKAVADKKHPETRLEALAALSQIASNPRAQSMIAGALNDPDPRVRAAAQTASGKSAGTPPEVVFDPFGYGPAEQEYTQKHGGDPARAAAILELARDHAAPVRLQLIADLKDKDLVVRATAARALGSFTWTDIPPALAHLFYDREQPVRISASASYIQCVDAMVPAKVPAAKAPSAAQ